MGLTQDEVAEKLGIGQEAVSRIERGITIPTIIRLGELSDIFDCGIDDLLIESSNRPNDQAKSIQKMLEKLTDKDRSMVMDTLQKLYERMKQ